MLNKLWMKLAQIRKDKKAFTLMEILIVLIVVALLMVIIMPNITKQRDKIDESGKENLIEIVETQRETYKLVEGAATDPSLDELVSEGYLTQKQADQAKKYDIQ